MESLVAQAKKIAESADIAGRRELVDTLRDLATSLEEPGDAVRRLAHTVDQPLGYPSALCTRLMNT